MFEWLWQILYFLGLFKKSAAIVLLGLDNAGKTTLLYKLKHGTVRSFIPTQRAKVEEVEIGSVRFKAWDLGGHESVRSLWRDHYVEADAVVFLVDSADTERLPEAKEELRKLLQDEEAPPVPLVILANKTDLPSSLPREQLISALGLDGIPLGVVDSPEKRPIQLFRCSLVLGVGYLEAFQWAAGLL